MNWQPIERAPKDGKEFLAYCSERPAFDPAPTWRYDIARWSGKSPDDKIGQFASRTGAIPAFWMPLPKSPHDDHLPRGNKCPNCATGRMTIKADGCLWCDKGESKDSPRSRL